MKRLQKIVIALSLIGITGGYGAYALVTNKQEPLKEVATQVKWYDTDATGQIMVSLRATPPPTGSGAGCYQSNSGDFCAREIQFDASVNPADLEGKNLAEIEDEFGEIELKGTAKHNN